MLGSRFGVNTRRELVVAVVYTSKFMGEEGVVLYIVARGCHVEVVVSQSLYIIS